MYEVKLARLIAAAVPLALAACLPRGEGERISHALSAQPAALAFPWAGDFSQGLAPVMMDGKYGFLDSVGRMAISPAWAAAGGFSQNRAPVLAGQAWGYLDVTGAMAIAPAFDWAGPFHEGFAPVALRGRYFFIDTAGNPLGAASFTEIRPFSQGLAAVKIGEEDSGAWGFIDARGEVAIPPLFAGVPRGFCEGLAAVRVDHEAPERVGFIDTSGGFALDTLFDAAGDFSEGLAPVGRGWQRGGGARAASFTGVWGFVDTAGRLAIEPAFAWAGGFHGGRALVRLFGGNYALIGRDGKVRNTFADSLIPAAPLAGELTPFRLRGRYGYMDASGVQALAPRFQEAGPFRDGWARARMGRGSKGFWVYVDRTGSYLSGYAVPPVTRRLPKVR
jgi:hypothetical protein